MMSATRRGRNNNVKGRSTVGQVIDSVWMQRAMRPRTDCQSRRGSRKLIFQLGIYIWICKHFEYSHTRTHTKIFVAVISKSHWARHSLLNSSEYVNLPSWWLRFGAPQLASVSPWLQFLDNCNPARLPNVCKWEQFSTFPYSCNFQNQESEFFPEYHKKIKNIDTDTSSTVY